MLELSPKYWVETFERLSPEQRSIAVPLWAPQDLPIVMQTSDEARSGPLGSDVAA
jgi:hypothetical protein